MLVRTGVGAGRGNRLFGCGLGHFSDWLQVLVNGKQLLAVSKAVPANGLSVSGALTQGRIGVVMG